NISVVGVYEGSGQYGLLISDIATGDSIELFNQITGGQPQVERMQFGATTIDLTIGIDMHGKAATNEDFYGSLLGDTYHLDAGIGHDRVIGRGPPAGVIDPLHLARARTASNISGVGVYEG